MDDTNPNPSSADYILANRQGAISTAINSLDDNPDEASRAVDLSKATGVPAPVVNTDLPNFERQHKARLVADLLNNNEYLRSFIGRDPMAAKVANDDYAQLDAVSQKVSGMSLPMRILRAPEALADLLIPGDPLKHFTEGGRLGSWISPEDWHNYPFAASVAAGLGTPAELFLRGLGGAIGTVSEAVEHGVTAVAGEGAGRELAALTEAELTGLTGRHGASPIDRVRPFVENGREPPRTVLPEYDAFRTKRNADDLAKLDEAVAESQKSVLRDRNPDLFSQFIAQHTDAEIGIGGDAVAALYGERAPAPDDGLLGWVPGIADKLAIARQTGDDVRVPLSDWLARVEPEVAKALHDDIRVRPGGITAREASVPVEPSAPLPEVVSNYRDAAGLEPLFSVGDRKLALQRMLPEKATQFGPEQGFHDFALMDEKGNPVGYINLSTQDGGKKLYVDMISGINGLGPRDFGPALMRSLLRQIKAEFPEAQTITGHRVSGMREKFGTYMEDSASPEIKLDNPKGWEFIDEADWRRILEGGEWQAFSSGTRAYLKPFETRTFEDRELINTVAEELNRIVPKKLFFHGAAERIEAQTGGVAGQRSGETIEPTGIYIRSREAYPIILYSLEAPNMRTTARHEALHHLRQYGFFTPEEWATLEKAASDNKWIDKFGIADRYPTGLPHVRLEEAIADAFGHWRDGAEAPPEVHTIFEKLKAFLEAIKARIGALLGKEPTWEDIFKKVETGEIGGREGTEPLDKQAFNEAQASIDQLRSAANDNYLTPEEREMVEDHLQAIRSGRAAVERMDPDATMKLIQKALEDEGKPKPVDLEFERWKKQFNEKLNKASDDLEPKFSIPDEPSRVFERANALGMTIDQYRRYEQLIAKRHAEDIEAATKRAEADQRKTQTKEWKDNRTELRKQVADDIRNRPDVAVDLFLGGDGLFGRRTKAAAYALDADKLTPGQKGMLPPEYVKKGGLDPDDVARMFGYGSGDAMVDRLSALTAQRTLAGMSAKDFVTRITDIETDRQMRLKYGVLEDNIIDAVKEQVVGQTQLDLLHEETVALGLKSGQPGPFNKADILGWVKQEFGKTPLSSIDSDRFMATAGKAGKAAEMALLNNDPATAFREKQRQYYATALAREAVQMENDLAKFEKVARRFSKREVANFPAEYTNFIHDILMRVGKPVRRSLQDLEAEIAAGEYHSLADFTHGKETFGLREVPVADFLKDPAFRTKFEALTAEQFQAVKGSIDTLVKNGRDEGKITKAGEAADLNDIKRQMIDQLKTFQERTYDAKGGRWMGPIPPAIASKLRTYGISHIQIENLFNRWDRDNPRGVFQQYVMRDLADAANNESVLEKRFAARLREIDDGADLKKAVDNPLFKVPGTDQLMPFNRGNLRTIMLNMGNKSNMVKMSKGYGLEPNAVMAWINRHATKEDWDWAQKMGDVFAELKVEADNMYRRLSGVAPEAIDIQPLNTPHGPYRGWYYPIIFHPEFEGPSKKLMGKDSLEQDGFVRATTPAGYTKSRTGYVAPLALDIDMLGPRMKQMIHDVAMREAVVNASKIFYDKDVRGAIFKHFGAEWRDMLAPYLVDVANSANYLPKNQRIFANASEFIRQNLINTLVGLNPGTVLKHGPTALIQSLHEVGYSPFTKKFVTVLPEQFLKSLKSLFSINDTTGESQWQFAMRESDELQRRHRNYVETLGGATDQLMPGSGFMTLRQTVQRFCASPVAISDLLSAVPTWLAQYEKSSREGAPHGDAVFDANRAVRRAHGSTAITNRSGVMRGGALSQWFASVYGFFNHIMNRQYELLWKAGDTLDLVKDRNYREAMQKAPELTSMLFAYVLAPALIEEMVTPLASTDNESWGKKAAKGLAFTLGASWVGIRDIASGVLNSRDPSVGLLSTAYKTLSDVGRDWSKNRPLSPEHAGKVVKDGATLLGTLTGVMPAQVGKTAEFGLGVGRGVEHPKGPWGWMVGVRFGTLKQHSSTFEEWRKHH